MGLRAPSASLPTPSWEVQSIWQKEGINKSKGIRTYLRSDSCELNKVQQDQVQDTAHGMRQSQIHEQTGRTPWKQPCREGLESSTGRKAGHGPAVILQPGKSTVSWCASKEWWPAGWGRRLSPFYLVLMRLNLQWTGPPEQERYIAVRVGHEDDQGAGVPLLRRKAEESGLQGRF